MAEDFNTISQNYLEVELLEDRTLFLDGEINIETVGKLLKQLLILQTRGKTKKQPIKLYINSPGGSVYDMLAVYDAIRSSPCEIHTIVTGTAMSAAAFILISGHKRYAYENSKIMLHELSTYKDGYVKFSDLQIEQQENQDLMDTLYKILRKHTKFKDQGGKKEHDYMPDLYKDMYLSATTALKWGLIDYIIPQK